MNPTNPLDLVEETDLVSVLHSLRHFSTQSNNTTYSSADYFGIEPLNAIVSVFKGHARNRALGHDRQPVVEVTSASSGGGKTHLCYYAIAAAVLAKSLGGKQGTAVVLDTDGKFDVTRLGEIMTSFVATNSEATIGGTLEDTASEVSIALRHVHVFRPQSLTSLVVTARSLLDYLLDLQNHYSAERSMSLLVLDSATAFFWQEKNELDHANAYEDDETDINKCKVNYSELVQALGAAQDLFDCSILATTWGILPAKVSVPSHGAPRSSFRSQLPPVWQNFCTCRVTVGREDVKKFLSGMTIASAIQDQDARMQAVKKGKFWCSIDWWELGESIRKGFRQESMPREFSWNITRDGVQMLMSSS